MVRAITIPKYLQRSIPRYFHLLPKSSLAKETWFYVREGAKFQRKDTTAESTALKASMDVNPEMRAALTETETGLLRPGALPALTTATAGGNKLLLEAIDKASHDHHGHEIKRLSVDRFGKFKAQNPRPILEQYTL